MHLFTLLCLIPIPKDPTTQKILRDKKFTMLSKFTIALEFALATPLCGHHLPWFYRHISSQRRVHVVKMGGIVKHYGVVIQYPVVLDSCNSVLVETNFEASKTLFLKAFQSLKNCLD